MIAWVFLAGAIVVEVVGTLALRVAALGRPRMYAVVLVAYVSAFGLLSQALRAGMGLGVGYGIWVAVGVALTAVASHFVFNEALKKRMIFGIALIAIGVLLIELGSASERILLAAG